MPAGSPCWAPSRPRRTVLGDEGTIRVGQFFPHTAFDKSGEVVGFGREELHLLRAAACLERICCVYADHDVSIMGAVRID